MKQLKFALSSALVLVLLGGCVSSEYMAIGEKTFAPRPREYVIDIYLTTDAPVNVHKAVANEKSLDALPQRAITVGRVDTSGAPAASWAPLIRNAKKKAWELGGDALVIKEWGHTMVGMDSYGRSYYGKNLSMTVVRYKP